MSWSPPNLVATVNQGPEVNLAQFCALDQSTITGIEFAALPFTSISGLNSLPNLTSLKVQGTNIATLDLSGCTVLQTYYGTSNALLTSLNVTGCTALQTLWADVCGSLTGITGITTCSALQTLRVNDDTSLVSLVLDGLANLTTVQIGNNPGMSTFSIINCSSLASPIDLTITNGIGNVTVLMVHGASSLTQIDFSGLTLSVPLDFAGCTAIQSVIGIGCNFGTTILNLFGKTSLAVVNIPSASAETLDLSGCSGLTTLLISDNNLVAGPGVVNLTGCVSLATLNSSSNSNLTDLDLHTCTGALHADISGCVALVNLDISTLPGCTGMTALDCSNDFNLPALNLSRCFNLSILAIANCSGIMSLDPSAAGSSLTQISADGSGIASINLLASGGLTSCIVSNTPLTDLDVTNCFVLDYLDCNNALALGTGAFPTIVGLNSTNITQLNCNSCPITELNIAALTGLISLNASGCNLQSGMLTLPATSGPALDIECNGNPSLTSVHLNGMDIGVIDFHSCGLTSVQGGSYGPNFNAAFFNDNLLAATPNGVDGQLLLMSASIPTIAGVINFTVGNAPPSSCVNALACCAKGFSVAVEGPCSCP